LLLIMRLFSLKVVHPPRAKIGTPILPTARYSKTTGADPVINVQRVGKPPRLSGLQIKRLLPHREHNALHVDNATQ
jgi:hypothetical protein